MPSKLALSTPKYRRLRYDMIGVIKIKYAATVQLIFLSTKWLIPEAITKNCIIILSIMVYDNIFSLHFHSTKN